MLEEKQTLSDRESTFGNASPPHTIRSAYGIARQGMRSEEGSDIDMNQSDDAQQPRVSLSTVAGMLPGFPNGNALLELMRVPATVINGG
jgi:hypothetical protein